MVSASRSWTISDPTIATVSANGAIAAQHAGNAVASCTIDGKTATAAVTVVPSPVAFLEVTPGAGVLIVGKTLQLVGTPLDSTGAVVTDHQIQWTTPDSSIATVSASGTVVGHLEGTANVIAVSGGKAAFAKINVAKQPPAPVASVSIRLDDATLNVGQLAHASATTTDVNGQVVSGRSIVWSVGNSSVISAVSTAGDKANVTGRGQGTAVLTATSEGKSASVTVAVAMAPVQTVVVNLASSNILPSQTTQATATLTDALGNVLTGRTVTWSSLDPSIATVSSVGVVTGVSTGAVILRATSEGQTGDGTETVGASPVATVTVTFGSSTLTPGQSTQAMAVARDAYGNVLTGRSVSWSSLNTSIATVSTSGMVTAVAGGSATIRAIVETKLGDASLTVTSAVVVPVATVTATVATTSLAPGQTTQATAVARDAGGNLLTGRTVGWSSLNPGVATVSSSGLVTAVTVGSATIRATVETKTGDAGLTVATPVQGATATVVATVDSSTLAPGHSSQGRAVPKDAQGNVLTGKTVTWLSKNTAIATVSATTGVVTGVSAGSVVIQATIDGIIGQASMNITVPSIIIAPGPTSGTLLTHNFDDGTLGGFYNPWGTGIDVVADPTGGGHGDVARVHYAADAITQYDDNRALFPKTEMAIGLGDSIWFRGDFYLPATVNDDPSTGAMRKLLYWGWTKDQWHFPHEFDMIITLQGSQLEVTNNAVGPSNLPADYTYTPTYVTKGRWHTIETQLKVNSSFAAQDGILRIWLDGTLIYDRTNMRWTDPLWTDDPTTYKWTSWGVGDQMQARVAYDEYRYWDNMTFAKNRVQP